MLKLVLQECARIAPLLNTQKFYSSLLAILQSPLSASDQAEYLVSKTISLIHALTSLHSYESEVFPGYGRGYNNLICSGVLSAVLGILTKPDVNSMDPTNQSWLRKKTLGIMRAVLQDAAGHSKIASSTGWWEALLRSCSDPVITSYLEVRATLSSITRWCAEITCLSLNLSMLLFKCILGLVVFPPNNSSPNITPSPLTQASVLISLGLALKNQKKSEALVKVFFLSPPLGAYVEESLLVLELLESGLAASSPPDVKVCRRVKIVLLRNVCGLKRNV